MTKVLVISDTHSRNERWIELINKLKPDVVLHAGDHCTSKDIMDKYATFWVAGNNDYIGNEIEIFTIENVKFILLHGHQANRKPYDKWKTSLLDIARDHGANVLIYGHSHIEDIMQSGNMLAINPGSLELPRNKQMLPTYATFDVDDNKISNIQTHYYF